MDQKFEGTPKAEIRLEGRKLIRGDLTNDWGSQLLWEVRRNGQVVAQVAARADASYEHPDTTPGQYEVVLQIFKNKNNTKNTTNKNTQNNNNEDTKKKRNTV